MNSETNPVNTMESQTEFQTEQTTPNTQAAEAVQAAGVAVGKAVNHTVNQVVNEARSTFQRFEAFRELERISNEVGSKVSSQASSFFTRESLTNLLNTDFIGGTALSEVAKRFTMGNLIQNPISVPFSLRADVAEDHDNVYMHLELPGIEKEHVSVNVSNDRVLTIKGERKNEFKEEGKSFLRMERSYGSFERSFTLPANVKTDSINAQFEHGVLSLTLPKTEESKPKMIAIEVK